ncbi:MAG: class I SAM-dependent methyltransferase [Bacteroidetes bacterium]|nr:class I SAM-dependent methyltransferase [Bacteroidota bacterium]
MITEIEKHKIVEQDWDIYWADKDKTGNAVYDFLAGIYRRLIVKNILNHFVRKYFLEGIKVLHAGCGSGQVDVDIARHIDITALDISRNALRIYKKVHGENSITVQGNIFELPFADNTFDGLYNLGVLEHFTQDEIHQILIESKRVLKPKGRILILWPPTFGFTVFVLDGAHFILNKIFRMKIKLHPDEITRVKSKKHAVDTFEKAGFRIIEYYFGIRDIFTQAVIVAEKP